MGRRYEVIDERLAEWISAQPVFFVATAPLSEDGHVNCSPKGNRGELAVLDDQTVAYLDQTGSGVETIAHLNENGRIVLMWCAFEGPPRVVRVHGRGRYIRPGDDDFDAVSGGFDRPGGVGVRAVVVVEADRVSDSCGYGVPVMDFNTHRSTMDEWSARKGRAGIAEYQATKNAASIDGLTGLA